MSKSIYTHKHHIIPKHAGGSNESSNIIILTVKEHALAHKKLYEKHGKWQDYLAWKNLSNKITKEETLHITYVEGGRLGGIACGKTKKLLGNKNAFGTKRTSEMNRKRSERMMGHKHSVFTKQKMRESHLGKKKIAV